MYSARLISAIAVAVVSAATPALAGCGSESSDTKTPTATAGPSGGQVEVGTEVTGRVWRLSSIPGLDVVAMLII